MSELPISRITRIPGLCGGKPTIRGTRMTVQTILELLASGMTFREILDDYPYLEPGDIEACASFAAGVALERDACAV